MDLKNIKANKGSIKEFILKNENCNINYLREVVNHGCISGVCSELIYYTDTHDYYAKYADEIDELIENYEDTTGNKILKESDYGNDLRNFLAWWSYELVCLGIINELGIEA